jgi:hypothetical protein
MPTHPEPPDRRRLAGRPDSYPAARILLAATGLGVTTLATVLLLRAAVPVLGWAALGVASIAVVDLFVVHRRSRRGRGSSHDRHGTAGPATYRR